jgi:glycosyltransferase involved in cell wall biosynthesis
MDMLSKKSEIQEMLPKVTVITVVLNRASEIEHTLKSVLNQNYKNLEYIVIDGESDDGTIKIIKKYLNGISEFISEKDKGIYDAMNKAADLANGEWLIFMNAGDFFVADDVVSRTFSVCKSSECDVIYGDGIYTFDESRVLVRAPKIATLTDGSGFSHQSCFIRTKLQNEYGFDLKESVAADYDFFLRLHRAGKVFKKVDVTVSEFLFGGFSNRPPMEVIKMRHRIYTKYYKRSNFILYTKLAKQAVKNMARTILPKKAWEMIKIKFSLHHV